MAHYPQSTAGLNYITYPVGPNAVAATIAAHASNNTKGIYTEFIASSPFECNYVTIAMTRGAAAITSYLIDLATGAGGAETVVIPNIIYANNNSTTSHDGASMRLPLEIAASTRIAARSQCSAGGNNAFMAITLIASGDTPAPTSYLNYGSNTANSMGVSVDPGGSTNTKGGYVEITPSTSAIIQILAFMVNLGSNTVPSAAQVAVDLATGAAASEVVLIPNLRNGCATGSAASKMSIPWYEFLTYIAASTRLSVNASCDINDATDRIIRVALLAATAPS